MSKLLILFLLLFINANTINEGIIYNKVDDFEIDLQANMYIVKGAELQKYSPNNELLYTYSNLILGDIYSVDVDKSTNIFLYYNDFNKIIFLDNTLSAKYSPVDISDLGFAEASLACRSYNNSFWIYDPVNQEIIRFDQSLHISDRTGNLLNVTDVQLNPKQILERNNLLYLVDKTNGVFVFDKYGGYLRNMHFVGLDDFYVYNNNWQMLRNDTSYIFNPITLKIDTLPLPIKNIKHYRANESKLVYLLDNGDIGEINI